MRSLSAGDILVRVFQDGDEADFRRLNELWIKRHFQVEGKDEDMFSHPRKTILEPGGEIFFALAAGQAVGCCALLRMDAGSYEVAKMAVAPEYQGRGIGRRLLGAVIEQARRLRARRLYLETNHILQSAIHLYEAAGFHHLQPDGRTPSPYARADVYMEMKLR